MAILKKLNNIKLISKFKLCNDNFNIFKYGQENKKLKIILLFAIIFILFNFKLYAEIVNLNKIPVYTKKGFDIKWIDPDYFPGDDWIKIEGNSQGKRALVVKDIPYKNIPKLRKHYFKKEKSLDFTFIFKFDIDQKIIRDNSFIGGVFAALGPNYQIYLNGEIVDNQYYIDSKGRVVTEKHTKIKYFELYKQLLKEKNNHLVLRITGEPTLLETGVLWDSPNEIDYYKNILKYKNETIVFILISLYLMICIYNLYLFVSYPQYKYHLYYTIFTLALLGYIFSRTIYFNQLIGNSAITYKIELVLLYFVFPSFGLFISDLLFNKIKKFVLFHYIFSMILILLTIVSNSRFRDGILFIWQITAIIPIAYYTVYSIATSFLSHFENYKSECLFREKSYSFKSIFWKTLIRSVPGNLIIGSLILTLGTVYDIVNAVFFNNYIFISQYSNLIFLITVTIIISRRFNYLAKKYEFVNKELIQNVTQLNGANKQILLSNKRYKLLADESNEIIFIMNKNFIFKEINTMVYNHLKYDPQDLIGKSFYDIIFEDDKHSEITKEVVNESFEKIFDTNNADNSVNFKILFKSRFESEPVEMRVYIVLLTSSDAVEIIGKAYPVIDDALVKYLDEELQLYSIDNYIMLAEDMTFRLTRNLTRYISQNSINIIRVALREIIMNAIEHGNLGITFEEKSEALKNGNYVEFLTERQKEISHKKRKVVISYYLCKDRVKYIVEDEGQGFDYKKFLFKERSKKERAILLHGRGISITKNIFDEIEYNEKGNRVALIKYFEKIDN